MTNINMMLSLLTQIDGSSSSEEINNGYMTSSPHLLQKIPMLLPQRKKILWDSQADK